MNLNVLNESTQFIRTEQGLDDVTCIGKHETIITTQLLSFTYRYT